VLWVLSQIALLAVLAVYARRGIRFLRESAAGPIGTGMLLGMLGIAIAWLVRIPFRAIGHWWDRRYEQTDLGYLDWLIEDWAVLAGGFVSLCLALLIVMGLARWLGEWWWIPGAGVFVGIAALFTFAFPYLDFGATRPLKDPELVAAANNYERELGLPHISLRVEDVSGYTELANAYAVGFGPTRRVVFWDTLLMPPFSEDEQEVVLAHELAHHGKRHLGKGIAWFAIFALPGAWILMRVTRGSGGIGAPEAVPLALLVVAIVQLAAAPLENHISRRTEAEADWTALELTEKPKGLEGAMVDLAHTSLGDPDPPGWVELMLGTHPALADRVAMADAWSKRR
jgi:Zn-dependent protease with chaperone function